jgi:hypothetical protein
MISKSRIHSFSLNPWEILHFLPYYDFSTTMAMHARKLLTLALQNTQKSQILLLFLMHSTFTLNLRVLSIVQYIRTTYLSIKQ